MPVFLDGAAKGCVTPEAFRAAREELNTILGANMDTTDANYETMYQNYLNLRWGFSLGFSDYDDYRKQLQASPDHELCNVPVYSTVPVDPYSCMFNLVDMAVAGANRLYSQYIDSVKSDFRIRYVNTCTAAKPGVSLNTSQQIYHYTLYYYAQAGNLLRTVPPEGVEL